MTSLHLPRDYIGAPRVDRTQITRESLDVPIVLNGVVPQSIGFQRSARPFEIERMLEKTAFLDHSVKLANQCSCHRPFLRPGIVPDVRRYSFQRRLHPIKGSRRRPHFQWDPITDS
jgi:hypothetical protein